MKLDEILEEMKNKKGFANAGMILCHNGVVRNTTRNGEAVKELFIKANRGRLKDVVEEIKRREGIVDVYAEVREGHLFPGDDIMYVVIAGDIREHVFAALQDAIARIKKEVTAKQEITISEGGTRD